MTGLGRGLAGDWGWPAPSVPQMRAGRDRAQPGTRHQAHGPPPSVKFAGSQAPSSQPFLPQTISTMEKKLHCIGSLAHTAAVFALGHSSASPSISSLVSHCTCFRAVTQSPLCVTPSSLTPGPSLPPSTGDTLRQPLAMLSGLAFQGPGCCRNCKCLRLSPAGLI